MQFPDFGDPIWFVNTTLILFFIITVRYFLFAGFFYGFFYKIFYKKWKARKLNQKNYSPLQFRREILWSMITSLLFAVAGSITIMLWQEGHTKIYTQLSEYGWWYLPVSLLVFMALHETYYYWLHRWMHYPKIFRVVHKVHHDSHIASPFTAFSFHPFEGFLQAIFLPLMVLIIPLHFYVIILMLMIMTVSSFINHLDIEIYPAHFHKHIVGRWLIGATHHSLHHKQYKYNFGLYFTFWDKLKKTESPRFNNLFDKITNDDVPKKMSFNVS